MKRFPSIRSNREFQNIYKTGKSYANRLLILYAKKNTLDYNRLGISVSKKVGNSVVRHGFARKLREIFRLNMLNRRGYDIVVIVRTGADVKDYQGLESAYLHLCKLHRLL